MKISVTYRSIDGAKITRSFKTLTGAHKFAVEYVGADADISVFYAVSADGVGKITVSGDASIDEVISGKPKGSAPVAAVVANFTVVEMVPHYNDWDAVSGWTVEPVATFATIDQAQARVSELNADERNEEREFQIRDEAGRQVYGRPLHVSSAPDEIFF